MTARIDNVRRVFDKLAIDGLVIANGTNMAYLTGFEGGTGDGLVLLGKENAALITDARYEEDYREKLPDGVQLLVTRDYWGVMLAAAKRFGIENLGFEDTLAFRDFSYIDDNFDGVDIVPVPELIEAFREIKDDEELNKLRRSAAVAVAAFNEMVPQLHIGMTEREVANLLDRIIKEKGADKPSFDTIVASGARGALPHGTYTDKVIEAGDLVTIDFGYYVDGYTSDVTRTLAFGQLPEEAVKIYGVVKEALDATLAEMKPGMAAKAVDKVARDVIEAAGYGAEFNHSTGHGVGLDIHEGPVLSMRAADEEMIGAGMLLTIEPGIYVADLGGVRIEDDVIVTADGVENLTAGIPTDLIVIEK
jgi:Xaa-Pro aminopeptidase